VVTGSTADSYKEMGRSVIPGVTPDDEIIGNVWFPGRSKKAVNAYLEGLHEKRVAEMAGAVELAKCADTSSVEGRHEWSPWEVEEGHLARHHCELCDIGLELDLDAMSFAAMMHLMKTRDDNEGTS